MKTIAIIPARGGSKRLPGKNLLSLNGIPLVAHSIRYALANPALIDQVYVSTDDPAIAKVATDFGALVIDRPAELSGDLEPTITAVRHVLDVISDEEIQNVVLLQPTNPLRAANLLTNAYRKFVASKSDSLFTVSKSNHKFGRLENSVFLPVNYEFGQRSQDMQPLYFENGLLYISTRALLMSGKIISENAFAYDVGDEPIVDIDTASDFAYAQFLMKPEDENRII